MNPLDDPTSLSFKKSMAWACGTCVMIFAVVWIWVLVAPLAYLDFNYPMWAAKIALLKDGRVGDVVILGDSMPNADLLPERLAPGVTNLALGGASPIDLYHQARILASSPKPPEAVIISIGASDLISADLFWSYSVGYGLLSADEVEEVRARSRALNDTILFEAASPGDLDARLKDWLYAVKFPSFYFPAIIHARIWGRYAGNAAELKTVLANRGHSYYGLSNGATGLDKETELKSFVPSKLLDDYFNRTLALLQSKNIPVYFLSMPHNEASVGHYIPGLKDNIATYLHRYETLYPGFRVLGDPLPIYPSEDFGDPWHLNEKGAAKWSDQVAGILNEEKVPGGPFGPN